MQTEQILFTFIVFLYGIIIGSFLNVCIYRIPNKESVAKQRSHCMTCGHRLAWYDLFPVFSYVFLKGRCRYCQTKISMQYPLIECINGLGYVWIFMVNGISLLCVIECLAFSALIVLSVIDWRTFEIPAGINGFLLFLGIAATLLDGEHVWNHLIGAVCVSGFLAILYYATKGRGMGGGDVKLMAVAGLLLGWQKILLALGLGSILGSVIHIMRMKMSGVEHRLAFGPYLSAGIILAMIHGDSLINWYLSLFIS